MTRQKTAVHRALDRMRRAGSVDEGDDAADELARESSRGAPSMVKTSPGLVTQARTTIRRLRAKA